MDEAKPPPLSDPAWRAAIGPRAGRYLPIFEKIEARGGGWMANWNWAAFAGSIIWFFYRRMPRHALGNLLLAPLIAFIAPIILAAFMTVELVHLMPAAGPVLYAVLVFLLLPMFADSLYYRTLKRRLSDLPQDNGTAAGLAPSLPAALGGALLGIGLPVAAVATAVSAYSDFSARAKVADAMLAAMDGRIAINQFHQQNRRLPTQEEGAGLVRSSNVSHAKTVAWDAAESSVIITMGGKFDGKRLRFKSEVREGAITWTCRNIDLPARLVPGSCRD